MTIRDVLEWCLYQIAVPDQYIFHHHFILQFWQIFSSLQFRQVLLYEQFHLFVCLFFSLFVCMFALYRSQFWRNSLQIFFEGWYWPNKGLQWIWVHSDNFWWRYEFLKFSQWWEIGIFGIFRDFFGPDPIIWFWWNCTQCYYSQISTQQNNSE